MKQSKFQGIISEFLYGGHILSAGASSIFLITVLILNLPIHWQSLLIPYLTSQVVYTYDHFRERHIDARTNPERTEHIKKNWVPLILSLYAGCLLVLCIQTSFTALLLVCLTVGAGMSYTDYAKSLVTRHIPGFKTVYVSLFWALSALFVPASYGLSSSPFFWCLCIFIFLRFLISTAFFDIKDINEDRSRGLKTLPVVLGKHKTLLLLQLLNIASIIPLVWGIHENYLPKITWLLGISLVYDYWYLRIAVKADPQTIRRLSYIVVDGEAVIWLLLIIVGKILFHFL